MSFHRIKDVLFVLCQEQSKQMIPHPVKDSNKLP